MKKKVGVARLKPTRYDNSKGTRIGPSLFYTSKLQTKYIKYSKFENRKAYPKKTTQMSEVYVIYN
jgi:hypothetical protein